MEVYAVSGDEPYSVRSLTLKSWKLEKPRTVTLIAEPMKGQDSPIVGPYGEHCCNNNGERLIDVCQNNDLRITNSTSRNEEIHSNN